MCTLVNQPIIQPSIAVYPDSRR
uniref:Uncharacterized protein n=1 Tax=Nelumbo nucifera TaxID=4432 RepID=A0A822YHV2_NELNU|nr:TPA_asm: hypothetical protein HUJ06_009357 [Nelumbo nucifera]